MHLILAEHLDGADVGHWQCCKKNWFQLWWELPNSPKAFSTKIRSKRRKLFAQIFLSFQTLQWTISESMVSRTKYGAYYFLMWDLQVHAEDKLRHYIRMDFSTFEKLLKSGWLSDRICLRHVSFVRFPLCLSVHFFVLLLDEVWHLQCLIIQSVNRSRIFRLV